MLAPLGTGGMGDVYRARDTRLGRDVALKLLPPEFASDPDRLARFEREASAVAALTHPNILVLYDVGTDQGIPYAVTELLEGETLRQRMTRAALPWRKAVEIAAALADGLAAAHAKGIVHRDLKPENVFLTTDERVKILDFGLAKVVPAPETVLTQPGDTSLTKSGIVLGTLPYMSPEQLTGEAVDVRSDIFAFGTVLFEMLSGKRPFTGNTVAELIGSVLHETPQLTESGRNAPIELQRIVHRCLDKNRKARFQSASELASAVRALLSDAEIRAGVAKGRGLRLAVALGSALALVLLAAVVFITRQRDARSGHGAAPGGQTIKSVAILPFLDKSLDPRAVALSDGVPRTIIRGFLEIPNINVRPFSSVAQYAKQETIDPREVGRQLDVEAVLAGTISPGEQSPVITVELMDVRNNRSLWLQSYNMRQDLLFIQDDILREVSAKMGWQLSAAQRERLARRPTEDTDAYLEYLEGLRAVHQWTVADIKRGIDRLERAVARDPNFALAYAALADAYIAGAYTFMEPRTAFEKARQVATEAMKRDPLLAEAHAAMATVKFNFDWDWAGADKDFKEAFRLNPRCSFAYDYYGWYWVAQGRPKEAIAALEKAVELEPRSMLYNPDLAFVYYHGRQFDAAERQARKTLELDKGNAMAPWALSLVFAHRDKDYASALRQAEIFLQRDRDRPDGYAMLGWLYGMLGEPDRAQEMLDRLDRLSRKVYVRAETRAWIYAGIGDLDKAFYHLNQVCDERSPGIIYFKLDPLLERVRVDPRYEKLLQRVGLSVSRVALPG